MDDGKCDSGCGEKSFFTFTAKRGDETPVKGELCRDHGDAVKHHSAPEFRAAGGHPPKLRDEMAEYLTDKETKIKGGRRRDEGSLERSDQRSTLQKDRHWRDDGRGL